MSPEFRKLIAQYPPRKPLVEPYRQCVSRLPVWPGLVRGVPNTILRTALFAAIKRGKRRYMTGELIASVDGIEARYTGQQLDQCDLDIWEGALHIARLEPLGSRIEFTEKGFLKMIGRGGSDGKSIGKSDREWLRKSFARLSATNIEIKQHGNLTYGGSLLNEYFRDHGYGCYVLILNARMVALFGRDGWTQIDWDVRRALRGYPLAQWLHGFYSSHAKPFPLRIETLHRLCGSAAGAQARSEAMRSKALLGWRDNSLVPALNALRRAIEQSRRTFAWEIDDDLVSITREPSRTQQRHLTKRLLSAIDSRNKNRGIEHNRRGD